MGTYYAYLYCDCYQKGKLKEPPPRPDLIYIDKSGKPAWLSEDPDVRKEFNEWARDKACEHDYFILKEVMVGYSSMIDYYHKALFDADDGYINLGSVYFFNLISRVIGRYFGYITEGTELIDIRIELELLHDFECPDPDWDYHLKCFRENMIDLVDTALLMGKPIEVS